MRLLRFVPGVLALAAAGCILTSGQFKVTFDLTPGPASPTNFLRVPVNLNSISAYADHKENLKDISEFAVLGEVTNHSTSPASVEAWITTDLTLLPDENAVRTNAAAKKIWGPFTIAGGATQTIDWNASAALFGAEGRAALMGELQGDGIFTAYLIGATGVSNFSVANGVAVLIVDAGM